MTKDIKQKTELAPSWPFNWSNLDRTFDDFRKEFERALTAFPSFPGFRTMSRVSSLSCDMVDEGDKYIVKAELPGVKKDEIKLNVFDNSLEISAQHKEEEEEKKKNYIRKERSEISYYRVLPIPDKILSDKTQAKLIDGVLNITLLKATPTTKPKSASIQVQ
jgi:HSP20 family protein